MPEDRRLAFRIGINIGDIILEDGDIYGDGVNVAARLEGLAETGGICLSRQAHDQVEGKLDLNYKPLGHQNLKNIAKPVEAYAISFHRSEPGAKRSGGASMQQEINFCRAPDGVRLAWAKVGSGPPLVKAANWMNHLEYDWQSPVWHHVLEGLARENTLIRYDARGNGLSDWDVDEISLNVWVSDLETVVAAAGVERFPLLGVSQGCAISIAYAVRHPNRVSHLILYGGFALGANKRSAAEKEKREAMATLMRVGWGTDDPSFRQLFTSLFIPEGSKEQLELVQRAAAKDDLTRVRGSLLRTVGGSTCASCSPRWLCRPSSCIHAAISYAPSRRPDRWLPAFQARASWRYPAVIICSWSTSRRLIASSRRSGFS